MKKYYFLTLIVAFALLFSMAAQAAVTPTINGTKKKTNNSLQLKIRDTGFKKRNVYVQLYVDEINEPEEYDLKYHIKLDKSGKANIKVNGLDRGTTYRFSVKMRLHPEDAWSDWSEYYQTTTRGSKIW